jgi:hypothetical protein
MGICLAANLRPVEDAVQIIGIEHGIFLVKTG